MLKSAFVDEGGGQFASNTRYIKRYIAQGWVNQVQATLQWNTLEPAKQRINTAHFNNVQLKIWYPICWSCHICWYS